MHGWLELGLASLSCLTAVAAYWASGSNYMQVAQQETTIIGRLRCARRLDGLVGCLRERLMRGK
jgi:hypothetical protein